MRRTREESKRYWESEKENLLHLYIDERKRVSEIAQIYGVSTTTIGVHLREFGVQLRKGAEARYNAKYSVDMNFFREIDTEEKAWTLGFILTDGHVSKRGHLMFTVQERDVDILQQIQRVMKTDSPIKQKANLPYYNLNISSEFICRNLREIGLNNRKTEWFDFDKLLSHVPEHLYPHLVRGMFDGDGSLCIYKYPYFKKHSYHFGYTGIKTVCDFIQDYFALGTKMTDEGNGYWTCISSNHAVILDACSKMYANATCYGQRKYHTYLEMKDLCALEYAS